MTEQEFMKIEPRRRSSLAGPLSWSDVVIALAVVLGIVPVTALLLGGIILFVRTQ